MDGSPSLTIGEWRVDPISGEISRGAENVRVDARLMRLLTCLAARAGEVVTTEELLAECWSGVVVTQDSVYQAVASLRRVLGDDSRRPAYIATVTRRGYRMVARVGRGDAWAGAAAPASGTGAAAGAADGLASRADLATAEAAASTVAPAGPVAGREPARDAAPRAPASHSATAAGTPRELRRSKLAALLIVGAVLCLAQAASVDRGVAPAKSVAVLPFLDLTTQSMDQEYFADGLTEELIGDLSRLPDLKVPSATAAFYFKGKQMTVANVARELGVAYIVDGSLRQSGSTFRVAARLVRADNGFVVWAGTFDRESDDVLKVQSEVAVQVTKQLEATLQTLTGGARNVQ